MPPVSSLTASLPLAVHRVEVELEPSTLMPDLASAPIGAAS